MAEGRTDEVVTRRYGCKEKPGALVTVTVPAGAETPARIAIRYPDEDYREYVFWWHDAPESAEDRAMTYSVEQDSKGEWHWFCEAEGCRWSGMGLLTEAGARREAERHDCTRQNADNAEETDGA